MDEGYKWTLCRWYSAGAVGIHTSHCWSRWRCCSNRHHWHRRHCLCLPSTKTIECPVWWINYLLTAQILQLTVSSNFATF